MTTSPNVPITPAQELANNLDALHQAGHGTMDIAAQVAISTGQPTQTTLAIADKIKQTASANQKSVDSFFNDAQQARIPSLTQQVTSTISSHFNKSVLYEDHVSKIQEALVKQGYAPKGTAVTGIWGPEWTQAASAARYADLTKPGIGNAPAKSTVQHILGALSLSRNANVILQVVKAIPRETLQAIGDIVSQKNPYLSPVPYPVGDNLVGAGRAIAQFGAKPENRTTNAEYAKRAESGQQAFQDVMTLLTFLPMGQLAKGIKVASAEAKTGVVALDVVKPKYTLLNSIVASAEAGTPSLLSASSKAFVNKPILKQIYWGVDKALTPTIAKTAPIQIAIRDTLAQRLRLPVVRAANKLGWTVTGVGLKEQGIALAESKTGGRQGTLDTTVYGTAPIAGYLAHALDVFAIQMNPATSLNKAATATEILGDTKKTADAFRNALDDMGALRAWQKANPKLDYHAIVAEHEHNGGSELDVLKEIGQQVNQIAVDQAFRELKNPLLTDGTWAGMTAVEKEIWAKEANKQIWQDAGNPDGLLQAARTTLVADQNALETGFANVGVKISEDVRAGVKSRKGISSFNQKLQANVALESLLENDMAKYFISPTTIQTFKETAKSIAEQTALEEYDLALGEGTGIVTRAKKPKVDAQFVENAEVKNQLGSIGMARLDTLTKTGANKMLNQLKEELSNTPKSGYMAMRTKIANALVSEFGIDITKLADSDANMLLDEFERQADGLALDLHIVRDAPQEVKDLIQTMKTAGYKPVIGTDIGHVFNKAAQFTDLGIADFRATSKVARFFGVSPRLSTSAAISARGSVETHRAVQEGIDAGKIKVLPSFNADRLLTYIRNKAEAQTELTPGQQAVMLASRAAGNYDIPIQKIIALAAKENKVITKEQAWNEIVTAKRTELGLREISYKDLMKILTAPMDKNVAELMGLPAGAEFMDAQSARNTVHAIWKARVNVPSEMIGGIAKLEDILYAGLYVGNKELGKNAMAIAAIPSRLMNLRSRVRYQESVVFAFRRMFKTMAKGITENIPPVLYPEAKMVDMGIAEEAAKIHAEIFPQDAARSAFLDDAERVVKEADFYNLYNPIASEQWASYWLAKSALESEKLAPTKLPDGLRFSIESTKPGSKMEDLIGPTHSIYILGADETKIGNMAWDKNTGEIGDLFVSKKYRRQGLATAMFDEATRLFEKAGEAPAHSKTLTKEGRKWKESVSSREPKKVGLTPEMKAEIAQKIENVMGYGERTAAERSLNTIFFPFSFNKTVMRQFGKFFLTHPGQRLLVSGMMNLYDQLNGPELKKWLDENAPLIKQLEAMNALEHGIGLGGYGGINAPYIQGAYDLMTVLGPKAIHYGAPAKNDATLATLSKYVPMIKEFNDLFLKPQDAGHLFEGQFQTTLKTVLDVAQSKMSSETFFNPRPHTNMGFQAQQTAAWDYRTQLIVGLTPVLDFNYRNPNAKKVWPDWIPVETGLQGLPINKATIGQLVHYKYPAWDNAASAVVSQQKITETNRFIGKVTARNPELGANYRTFDDLAKRVSDAVAKDSIDPSRLATITDGFRQVAISLAKQDNNFGSFYKTHYERTFGPLERLTK